MNWKKKTFPLNLHNMPDVAFLKDMLAVAGNATNSSPRICNPALCQIQTHFLKYKFRFKTHIAKGSMHCVSIFKATQSNSYIWLT